MSRPERELVGNQPKPPAQAVSAKAEINTRHKSRKGEGMNNLNSILLEGNLVRDPPIRETAKGSKVCTMTLASNRYYKMGNGFEKEVSFFDVETWARLAEACYNKGRKGRSVRVVGRLRQDRWTGSDSKPHSRILIVADHVEFKPEFAKSIAKKTVDSFSEEYTEESEIPPDDEIPDEASCVEATEDEILALRSKS